MRGRNVSCVVFSVILVQFKSFYPWNLNFDLKSGTWKNYHPIFEVRQKSFQSSPNARKHFKRCAKVPSIKRTSIHTIWRSNAEMRAGNVNHVTFLAILSHFDVETLVFTLEVVPEKIFTTSFKRSRKKSKSRKIFTNTSNNAPRSHLSNAHRLMQFGYQTLKCGGGT